MAKRLKSAEGGANSSAAPDSFDLGGGSRDTRHLPTIEVKPAFFFAWHPNKWHIMDGKLVPMLRKVRIYPGVSGIEPWVGGQPRISIAKARMQDAGWHILDYSLGPDGTYLKPIETRRPGGDVAVTYVSAWEHAYGGSSRIGSDTQGYVAWLESLVKDGVIDPCPSHVAEELLEALQLELGKLEAEKAKGITSVAPAIAQVQGSIKIVKSYISKNSKPVRAAKASTAFDLGGE